MIKYQGQFHNGPVEHNINLIQGYIRDEKYIKYTVYLVSKIYKI